MKTRFICLRNKGPAWDHGKLRREQSGWPEHAAFMDQLTAEGFVVLGGPLGEGDGEDALLVIDAPDEESIHERLKDDPWQQSGMLQTRSTQRWTMFLEG